MKKNLVTAATTAGLVLSAFGATASAQGNTYTVQTGDSLWKIAKQNNVSIDNLKAWNHLSNDTIYVNQELSVTYTVRAGDSLWKIARAQGTTVSELKRVNGLTTDLIQIGQSLKVPVSKVSTSVSASSISSSPTTYVIQKGDSLSTIGARYHVTVPELKSMNQLTSNKIIIGNILRLRNERANAAASGTVATTKTQATVQPAAPAPSQEAGKATTNSVAPVNSQTGETAVPARSQTTVNSGAAANSQTTGTPAVPANAQTTVNSGAAVNSQAAGTPAAPAASQATVNSGATANSQTATTQTAPASSQTATTQTAPDSSQTATTHTAPASSQTAANSEAPAPSQPTVNQAASATSQASGATKVQTVISEAKKYIGTPYRWGGTTTSGFDCSGFVQFIYNKVGVSVPRTTSTQWSSTTPVGSPSVGDLVFFETYQPGPSHVGIYLGSNQFISATDSGVKISDMTSSYWAPKYLGARKAF